MELSLVKKNKQNGGVLKWRKKYTRPQVSPPHPRGKDYDIKSNASAEQAKKLPHNYEDIIKAADSLLTKGDQLHDLIYSTGVFLENKKKKYWVDKSNSNCFMLHARDLSITWVDNNRYWNWRNATRDGDVDVAELLGVLWLEVHGNFDTSLLSQDIDYEVVFAMMLKADAYGWEDPVNLRLTFPNGKKQEHTENFMEKERNKWIEVRVGEFKTSQENAGMLGFILYQYEGHWKSGLVIKGVEIRPKN